MFSTEDLTARARIREAALRLFAEHGPDAVTVRQIAAAAGVSAGLVVHHFASKEGLRMAVDEHVAGIFDGLFGEFTGADAGKLAELMSPEGSASLAELLMRSLPADSAVPAYLRRLLLSGEPAGTALFRRWYQASEQLMAAMTATGMVEAGADPPVRTAFLMVNDLAMLLLRDHLVEVLGLDPLGAEGMGRWMSEAVAVYRDGLFSAVPGPGPDAGRNGEEER